MSTFAGPNAATSRDTNAGHAPPAIESALGGRGPEPGGGRVREEDSAMNDAELGRRLWDEITMRAPRTEE